jgi:type IV pilus assembly protein PilA
MVIIIIGILAAIAIPTFLAQRQRPWEANAMSDVRNAAAAATSCSSQPGNDGNYQAPTDCATLAALTAQGYNQSANVTINGMNSSPTGWTISAQHNAGGQAFTFTTANGRVTAAARGAAAPAAP